jgi:hypothetical protein
MTSDLTCTDCGQPIEPGQNHTTDPVAHIPCAIGAGRMLAEPRPMGQSNPVTNQLRMLGYAITGDWREHSAWHAERPHTAVWDRPDHLPYVAVSQTPCPTVDLGQADPEVRLFSGYMCRRGHIHPYSADRIRHFQTTAGTA